MKHQAQNSIELYKIVYENNDINIQVSNTYNLLGLAQAELDEYQESVYAFNKALNIRRSLDMYQKFGTTKIQINISNLLNVVGEYRKSCEVLE